MANSMRGEAEITVAGKKYLVRGDMNAIVHLAEALGVESMPDLPEACHKITNMPKVVAALLKASGHEVPASEHGTIDWTDYYRLMGALFSRREDDAAQEGGKPHPQKANGRAATATRQ